MPTSPLTCPSLNQSISEHSPWISFLSTFSIVIQLSKAREEQATSHIVKGLSYAFILSGILDTILIKRRAKSVIAQNINFICAYFGVYAGLAFSLYSRNNLKI